MIHTLPRHHCFRNLPLLNDSPSSLGPPSLHLHDITKRKQLTITMPTRDLTHERPNDE